MTDAGTYPSEASYTDEAVLKDGSKVPIRAIRPEDGDRLEAMMDRCSEETLYFRFLSPRQPTLSRKEVAYFTGVDHDRRVALVGVLAEDGKERIIGEGRWDVLPDNLDSAEVAFLVEDDYQGKGLGTALLAKLASLAPVHGINTFEATVLADNRAMLDVFHKTGYRVTHEIEAGVYNLVFPIRATAAVVEAEVERESAALAASLASVLEPRRVAIVGGRRDPRAVGAQLVRNVVQGGFTGTVHPVNPDVPSIASVPAVGSTEEVPEDVDLAVITVSGDAALEAADCLGGKGVKALLFAGARWDAGGGADVHNRKLLDICRGHGIRLVGPTSVGVVNTDPRLQLHLALGQTRSVPGVVGVAAHTGPVGIGLLEYLARRDVGVSQFVSLGDRIDISSNDLIAYWGSQEATRVVLLYIESFQNPATFSRLARRVGRDKPLAAVIVGIEDSPGRHALSRQCGVIQARTLEELVDVAALLSTQPLPAGRRVLIVSNSGGAGRIAAQACLSAGLELAEPSARTVEIATTRGHTGPPNPVTLPFTTEAAGALAEALRVAADDPQCDCILVTCVPADPAESEEVAQAIVQASQRGRDKTFAVSFMASHGTTSFLRHRSVAVPTFIYPEAAAQALGHAATYAGWRRGPEGTFVEFDDLDAPAIVEALRDCPTGLLDGDLAWELLRLAGIPAGAAAGESFVVRMQAGGLFGALLGLGHGADPVAICRDDFRIVPLTDAEAHDLVTEVLESLPGDVDLDAGALSALVLRLSALLGAQARISAGDLVVQLGTPSEGVGVTSVSFRIE